LPIHLPLEFTPGHCWQPSFPVGESQAWPCQTLRRLTH
jgi:hypothetical protein